jgi:hypothetical protein
LTNTSLLPGNAKALVDHLLSNTLLGLRSSQALPIKLLSKRSLLLSRLSPLTKHLLPKCRTLLSASHTLTKHLLAQCSTLLRRRHFLAKALLTNPQHLLSRRLLSRTIGLLCRQGRLLLLLGSRKSLPVALLIDIPHGLPGGQTLLLRQDSLRNPAAITAKSARPNLVAYNPLLLLLLLLLQSLQRRLSNRLNIRRHILLGIQSIWINLPRASKPILSSKLLIWRTGSLGRRNALTSHLLHGLSREFTTA